VAASPYELLDFGAARKLERWGDFVLDRRSPTAEGFERARPRLWSRVDARYERAEGTAGDWQFTRRLPDSWPVRFGDLTLTVRLTDFGHVGVFPEHAENWAWIANQVRQCFARLREQPEVLNLFAYTGGATLAAAAAGARVVHVDASKSVVAWARANAETNGLADRPIRWITDDARQFVTREIRRGRRYDGIILDPPSYGHGKGGAIWKFSDHVGPLLADCRAILRPGGFVVFSAHSPGVTSEDLAAMLVHDKIAEPKRVIASDLNIKTASGRSLPSGSCARTGML
jgi:23S rRNA (cytosine1962-C5)-methyltransferase